MPWPISSCGSSQLTMLSCFAFRSETRFLSWLKAGFLRLGRGPRERGDAGGRFVVPAAEVAVGERRDAVGIAVGQRRCCRR